MTQDLVIAPPFPLAKFTLNDTASQLKELALDGAALIGKVSNGDENEKAVKAQIELKRVIALFEKSRKAEKEPALEYGRKLDKFFQAESEPLDVELGRLSALVGEFAAAEQRRVVEERRLQQAELDRIEREKQAELKRIADEVAAKEAEALKIQGDAARRSELERIAAQAAAKSEAVTDKAAAATYAESRPVVATRAEGQIVKTDWQIQVVNPYELAKNHPDCVNITPRLTEIKAYLNNGVTIKGITAVKVMQPGVRLAPERKAIEV